MSDRSNFNGSNERKALDGQRLTAGANSTRGESGEHGVGTIDELITGKDFNYYHGDWAYWYLPILERMRKTEELLEKLSVRLRTVQSVVGHVFEEVADMVTQPKRASRAQILVVLWPVVYDVAAVNLRLDNSLFYFDLNSHEDPFDLINRMCTDADHLVNKVLEILRDHLDGEVTWWFHQGLDFLHPGLAFIERKLVYDICELEKSMKLIDATDSGK